LNLSAGYTRTDGAFVFNPSIEPRLQSYNTYTAALQIQQTLFDFGRTINRVSSSTDLFEAASYDAQAARDNIVMNVQIAYFGVVQARDVLTVNELALRQAEDHLREAKAFYNAGRRPLFDVTKAEVDVANANVNLIRARNQLRVAEVQLMNAMGTHPPQGYDVTDTLTIVPFAMSLDSVKVLGIEHRPDIRAARARLASSQSLVAAAMDQHLPTLSAVGNWTWTAFHFPLFSRWNAGVTLSVPVFQGFAVSAQVEQAEAVADQAKASLDLLIESTTLEVEQTYLGLKEAEERIGAATKLVKQAEENLNLAEKQYAAGVGTPIEITDAQLTLSNARITYIQALYDYNSFLVRLKRAIGISSSTSGQE
jgi:outer membrane protein TolC